MKTSSFTFGECRGVFRTLLWNMSTIFSKILLHNVPPKTYSVTNINETFTQLRTLFCLLFISNRNLKNTANVYESLLAIIHSFKDFKTFFLNLFMFPLIQCICVKCIFLKYRSSMWFMGLLSFFTQLNILVSKVGQIGKYLHKNF